MASGVGIPYVMVVLLVTSKYSHCQENVQMTSPFLMIPHMEILTNLSETVPNVGSSLDCIRTCVRQSLCASAKYVASPASCELNLDSTYHENTTVDTSTPTRNSILVIRQEAAEDLQLRPSCGPPPAQEGLVTTAHYNGYLEGDTAVSRCAYGYSSDPPEETRYCQSNRTWSPVTLLNCTKTARCDVVAAPLRVDCGYPGMVATDCLGRGCCWDPAADLNVTECYFADRAIPQVARTLYFHSPSHCDVYTPSGLDQPAGGGGHQVSLSPEVRVVTLFLYGPVGVRARLSDGLTLDTTTLCRQAPRYYSNITSDWFSEVLNDQDWVNAVNLSESGDDVMSDVRSDVPAVLSDVTPVTLPDAGPAFVFCRWRL